MSARFDPRSLFTWAMVFVALAGITGLAGKSLLEHERLDDATELLDAACVGDIARLREALSRTGTTEVRNAVGLTPLACAAMFGQRDAARCLIDAGADVNATTDNGCTPLMFAADHQDELLVQMLLEASAAADTRSSTGNSALLVACQQAKEAHLRTQLKEGHLGTLDVVKRLVDAGASVQVRGNSGRTPLIAAAEHGDLPLVQYLLANGADPKIADAEGNTATSMARARGHDDVANLLERGGAPAPESR